jgi:hypothetical protein
VNVIVLQVRYKSITHFFFFAQAAAEAASTPGCAFLFFWGLDIAK